MANVTIYDREGNLNSYDASNGVRFYDENGAAQDFFRSSDTISSAACESDVNFWDYDGTLIASYTKEEVLALSELPPVPTPPDDVLTVGSWNWTLEEIQAAVDWGCIDVSACYSTKDGSTYFDIELISTSGTTANIKLTCQSSQSITIDWGDGTTTTGSISAGGSYTYSHTYSLPGVYRITMPCPGYTTTLSAFNLIGFVKRAFLGWRYIGNSVFKNMRSLETVVVGSIWAQNHRDAAGLFSGASNLRFIGFPRSFTYCGGSFLYQCFSLRRVSLPPTFYSANADFLNNCFHLRALPNSKNITTISGSYFAAYCSGWEEATLPASPTVPNYCHYCNYGLRELIIPEGVTTLGTYFASCCYSLKKLVLPSTITSVGENFLNSTGYAKIYVPDDMVDTFKAMSNVTSFASKIQPMSAMTTNE